METNSVRRDSMKKWLPSSSTIRNCPVDSWRQAFTFSGVVVGSMLPLNAVSGQANGAAAVYRYECNNCRSARSAGMATSRISGYDSDVARLPYCWSNDRNSSASDCSESPMTGEVSYPGQGRPDTKRCVMEPGEVSCSQRARSNPMTAPRLCPKIVVGSAGSDDTASINARRIAPQSISGASAIVSSRPGSCTTYASAWGGSSFAQGRNPTTPAPANGMHISRTRAMGRAARLFSRIIVAAGSEVDCSSAFNTTVRRSSLPAAASMRRSASGFGAAPAGTRE